MRHKRLWPENTAATSEGGNRRGRGAQPTGSVPSEAAQRRRVSLSRAPGRGRRPGPLIGAVERPSQALFTQRQSAALLIAYICGRFYVLFVLLFSVNLFKSTRLYV